MKIKTVNYTSKFKRNFKKLPRSVQKKAAEKEKIFRKDPLYPTLKTHRLKGPMSDFYSFSIDYRYRIVFAWENGDEVTFIDAGGHSIYR
jgi:addiction module RelE/StbE family toxin